MLDVFFFSSANIPTCWQRCLRGGGPFPAALRLADESMAVLAGKKTAGVNLQSLKTSPGGFSKFTTPLKINGWNIIPWRFG